MYYVTFAMETTVLCSPQSAVLTQKFPQQASIPAHRCETAASGNQLPRVFRHHDRNREAHSQPPQSATEHDTPEQQQVVNNTLEPYLYRGVEEGGGTNGTGLSGTVMGGTAQSPYARTMQPPEDRKYSSPSACGKSPMKVQHETRNSRSQSLVRRASIGSVKEEITSVFPLIFPPTLESWLTGLFPDIPQSFLDESQKPPQPRSIPTSANTNYLGTRDTLHTLSESPNFYCPAAAFQGWKQVKLAVKTQSKSSSDLKRLTSLRDEWFWDLDVRRKPLNMDTQALTCRRVGIEHMPFEILGRITSSFSSG